MQYILFSILIYIFSFSANATLTSVDNGFGVYDDVTNLIWASNGNILNTMEAQNGVSATVNAIIAANNGIVYYTSDYYNSPATPYSL